MFYLYSYTVCINMLYHQVDFVFCVGSTSVSLLTLRLHKSYLPFSFGVRLHSMALACSVSLLIVGNSTTCANLPRAVAKWSSSRSACAKAFAARCCSTCALSTSTRSSKTSQLVSVGCISQRHANSRLLSPSLGATPSGRERHFWQALHCNCTCTFSKRRVPITWV